MMLLTIIDYIPHKNVYEQFLKKAIFKGLREFNPSDDKQAKDYVFEKKNKYKALIRDYSDAKTEAEEYDLTIEALFKPIRRPNEKSDKEQNILKKITRKIGKNITQVVDDIATKTSQSYALSNAHILYIIASTSKEHIETNLELLNNLVENKESIQQYSDNAKKKIEEILSNAEKNRLDVVPLRELLSQLF